MRQLLGSPDFVVIPVSLSCPRKVCGQEWTATAVFEMPGWWQVPGENCDLCCPVCGTPGRLLKKERVR